LEGLGEDAAAAAVQDEDSKEGKGEWRA
jgi:hypothetical protein